MDYMKLNKATRNDHFPLLFIDQILDRLEGKEYCCILDGCSRYNQNFLTPEDQEKTIFTRPYGTFDFTRMPFGLYNASASFQRCMLEMFSHLTEYSVELFMDEFSIFLGIIPKMF